MTPQSCVYKSESVHFPPANIQRRKRNKFAVDSTVTKSIIDSRYIKRRRRYRPRQTLAGLRRSIRLHAVGLRPYTARPWIGIRTPLTLRRIDVCQAVIMHQVCTLTRVADNLVCQEDSSESTQIV